MLSNPRYGLPPPPVPRLQAPTASDSMSSRVISRIIVRTDLLARRPLSLASEKVADGLGDDGVRQDDRDVEHGETVAVPLGKADAVEQDCLGAFRPKPFAGREYRLRSVAIRANGGKQRSAGKRAPLVALGVDLRGDRHDDAELPVFHQAGDRGRNDVVGLDEPRTFTLQPLERARAEDQNNVA